MKFKFFLAVTVICLCFLSRLAAKTIIAICIMASMLALAGCKKNPSGSGNPPAPNNTAPK